ncbi:MAG: hypothetical protein ACYSU6_03670 [Planctomycetota bacterium]|jgi:hypothetical protein
MSNGKKEKAEAIAAELKHLFKARLPNFKLKWSREWVIPDNVLLPDDANTEMQVNCMYPANRPRAKITVLKQWNNGTVPKVKIPALKLENRKVVKDDGKRPSHKLTLENGIWDKYDKLEYHFKCQIDRTKKTTTKALKVKRWHVQALDTSDDDPNNANNIYQLYRITERANFVNAFAGSDDDKAHAWDFNANNTDFATFGEKMENTYTFVYTGHGAVMCRKCQQMWDGRSGQPQTPAETAAGLPAPTHSDAEFGTWTTCSTVDCKGSGRSTHCIGSWQAAPNPSFMDGTHISDEDVVSGTPKYLMFSVCCGGAFESSLYDAYIGRGTKYCVGFKKSTRCDWARDYARSFFDTWVGTHECDPSKIPEVFNDLQSTWEARLQPCLFGKYWGAGSHIRNLGRRIVALF